MTILDEIKDSKLDQVTATRIKFKTKKRGNTI